MAGVEFGFILEGDQLEDQLAALERRATNLLPAFDNIGQDMVTITTSAFEESRSPEGLPWTPSAAALAEGRQTLIDRGLRGGLMGSFSYIASDGGVTYGTKVEHAAIHQFGGTIQPRGAHAVPLAPDDSRDLARAVVTFPPRPFVGAGDRHVRRWEAMLVDHLAGDGGAA